MPKNLKEMLNRLNDIGSKEEMTMSEMKEYLRLGGELRPYQCPNCFQYILEGEEGKEYVTINNEMYNPKVFPMITRTSRWHIECKAKRDEFAEKVRERREKEEKQLKRMRYEHEHSLRPKIWHSFVMVYGLKKDYERFMKDMPNLLKGYNLNTGEAK